VPASDHRSDPRAGTRTRALARRLGPRRALALVLLVGLAVVLAASSWVSGLYVAVTDDESVALLDEPTLRLATQVRSSGLDDAVTAWTTAAGVWGLPALALVVVVVLALRDRSWLPVVLGLAAGGGSVLMTLVGKELVGRDRPPLSDAVPPYETSASFPSGHTLNATVVVGIVAWLLVQRQTRRCLRVLTVASSALLALSIGLSRVYLGHHWLTDVLAGWLLAAAWLTVVVVAHRAWLLGREAADEPSP
jgi:undecaprenyl-diphosphatase